MLSRVTHDRKDADSPVAVDDDVADHSPILTEREEFESVEKH